MTNVKTNEVLTFKYLVETVNYVKQTFLEFHMVFFHVVLIEEVCINILSKLNTLTRALDKCIIRRACARKYFYIDLKKKYINT